MFASNNHVVDLRPQSNRSFKKKGSRHFSLGAVLLLILILGVVIGGGGLVYGLNHLENKDSQLAPILPSLAENLSGFEWQKASDQISSFNNKNIPKCLDNTFLILVEKTPIGHHYKYVKLYYSLESLNQTLRQLQTIPVLKSMGQTGQSWGDVYPDLIKNLTNIGSEIKDLGQMDVSQAWTDLKIQLDKLNQLFGGNQPINYLLLLNDYNQSRPLGGVIGGVVAVTVSQWQISYWRAYNASSLDNQISSKIVPPKEIQPITTNWTLRQSNWFGDINLFTQSFISLWQKSGASSLFEPNAIVLFNAHDLKPLDTVLSNLNVSGTTIPNLRNYLENNLINYRLSSGPLDDNYLDFINDNLLPQLTAITGQEWLTVLRSYIQAPTAVVSQKYYFFPWKQASLAKTFNADQNDASFWFTSSDINTPISNLTSQNIKTSLKLDPKIAADGYKLDWTVSLTNSNTTAFNDYIRFYIPPDAIVSSVSGFDKYLVPNDPINYRVKNFTTDQLIDNWEKQKQCAGDSNYCLLSEGNRKAIAGWLKIKPGQTKTLKFSLELPIQSQTLTLIPQTAMNNMLQIVNNTVLQSSADMQTYVNHNSTFTQSLLIKFIHD
ncbi:MAG TPA: hypothetical protein PK547_01495 [Candidatus Paceibacterota bacterium]|nr:hypothetical protein [Candidatus Paceibacterota bacterium]